jgi:hypothetical protein
VRPYGRGGERHRRRAHDFRTDKDTLARKAVTELGDDRRQGCRRSQLNRRDQSNRGRAARLVGVDTERDDGEELAAHRARP